jgi:hypothetical protein
MNNAYSSFSGKNRNQALSKSLNLGIMTPADGLDGFRGFFLGT